MAKMSIRLIVVSLMLAGLAVYAVEQKTGPRMAWHTFEFDGYPGIEILDWSYGDPKLSIYHTPEAYSSEAHIPQGSNAAGNIPVGDYFYAKWRVKATGKVYEDKVDLKTRLPSNMEDKILQFSFNESQLYVYLIEGNDSKALHAKGASDCPASSHQPFRCAEIYPKHWKNF